MKTMDGNQAAAHVSFAYTEKPVIRNFNMRAHKNTKIVLSGKNGSGKTIGTYFK